MNITQKESKKIFEFVKLRERVMNKKILGMINSKKSQNLYEVAKAIARHNEINKIYGLLKDHELESRIEKYKAELRLEAKR